MATPEPSGSRSTSLREDDTQETDLWRSAGTWRIVLTLGVLLGVVDSSQSYFLGHVLGLYLAWHEVLICNVTFWAAFGALIPAVFFFANRYRLDGPIRYSRVALHCLGAVFFALIHIAISCIALVWVRGDATFQGTLFRTFRDYAAAEFVSYWAIVAAFYVLHYYREAQRRKIAAAQLQVTLAETRLQVLRSQLNPHFLFNTLNSISTLSLKGEHQATGEMLARLSDLLRVALDERCPQEVPLAKELDILEQYLSIQRIRFADRLSIEHRVSPDTRDALVPSMILQPLAENAIRHGIDARCGAGVITIESERLNGSLRLRVSDTGPGFSHDRAPATSQGGFGLSNTRARLEQLYGANHLLEFGRSESGGGSVTMTIPFHT